MECPVLTTTAARATYNATSTGAYNHIRMFQTGYRFVGAKSTPSWILPALCSPTHTQQCPGNTEQHSAVGGYSYRTWTLPTSNHSQSDDDSHADAGNFPVRFSAVCWYFGKSLSDKMAASSGGADPVPSKFTHAPWKFPPSIALDHARKTRHTNKHPLTQPYLHLDPNQNSRPYRLDHWRHDNTGMDAADCERQ